MSGWLFEVSIIAPLALLGGSALERFFKKLSPRPWHQRGLPHSTSGSAVHLGLETTLYAVLAAIGAGVLAGLIGAEVSWYRILAILLPVAVVVWGIHALAKFSLWWLLEPGCPLRGELDRLSESTGVTVRRVRLREGARLLPRVFPDGSMELTTAFFSNLPNDEQVFLVAATLEQYRNRRVWRQFLEHVLLVLGFLGLSVLVHLGGRVSEYLEAFLMILAIVLMGISWGQYQARPRFRQVELQAALEQTGDLEITHQVVMRVDSSNAKERLKALTAWWQAKHPMTGATTASPRGQTQQQTLGRRP